MDKIEAPTSATQDSPFRFRSRRAAAAGDHAGGHPPGLWRETWFIAGLIFEAERGERTVLVGPNGAGQIHAAENSRGRLDVQKGERNLGHNVKVGYYSQYRVDMLDPEPTVLEKARHAERVTEQFVRTMLGCFLFRGDDVFKKVGVLSGGEKSRLALVKLLLDPPNLLLMDEPTTHLDMSSIDALLRALEQFEGTLIFISHDVYFIRELANQVLHVNAGQLTHYAGDYHITWIKRRPSPAPR